MKKLILFRVNAGGEAGAGHLTRCLVLARALKQKYDPYFLVKGDNKIGELLYRENFNFKLAMHGFKQEVADIRGLRPNLIVLDLRETPLDFVRTIKEFAPVLTIDDGGSGATAANLALYTLPMAEEHLANYSSLQYLIFDDAIGKYEKTSYARKAKRVLVSFGGSDPADLSSVMIRINKLCGLPLEWTMVRGVFNRNEWSPGNYQTIDKQESLFPLLAKTDLLLTSFGMTAFEAAAIGTPVLLINPGPYHETLATKSDLFTSLGVFSTGKEGDNCPELCAGFQAAVQDYHSLVEKAKQARETVDKQGAGRVLELIEMLLEHGNREACPVCHQRQEVALVRDTERSLFRCENCRLLFQRYFRKPPFEYGESYFNEEYREQYGRSYLEDRPNIERLNRARLEIIDHIQQGMARKYGFTEKRMLEVGSAYGFFLDYARDQGWEPFGVEVAASAARYARDTLKLEVASASFLEADVPMEQFHCAALWYVLEHLPRLNAVMEKLFVSLKRGGIIAISTPNSRGYTGRFRPDKYLSEHPNDHFHDFSVANLTLLLKRYRFRVVKVRMTGIHYERFLEGRNPAFWDNNFFRKLYNLVARLFKLGDTFEIYAVKR